MHRPAGPHGRPDRSRTRHARGNGPRLLPAQVLTEDHAPFSRKEDEAATAERRRRGPAEARGGGRERARAGADVPGRRLRRGSSSAQGSQLRHHLADLHRSSGRGGRRRRESRHLGSRRSPRHRHLSAPRRRIITNIRGSVGRHACRRLRGRARQRAQVLSHQSHDARFAHRGPTRTAPAKGSRKRRGYP